MHIFSFLKLTGGAKAEAVSDEWALTFSQPASDYINWKNKLEKENIALENVFIRESESLLIGTVKVNKNFLVFNSMFSLIKFFS